MKYRSPISAVLGLLLGLLLGLAAGLPAAAQPPPRTGAAPAPGKLLVASRSLHDPNFAHTAILLLEADENGAFGLVINRPLPVTLGMVFPETEGLAERRDPVYRGGPVEKARMMVLVRSATRPEGTEEVIDGVWLAGDRKLLEGLATQEEEARRLPFRVYAGYAGWAPDQLEREIARGGWHLLPADAATVFSERPEGVWDDLIQRASGRWARLAPSFTPTRWSQAACW